jgi:hypothetical protein
MYADFTWMHRRPLPVGEKGQNGWLVRTTCASREIRNSDSDSGQTANAPPASTGIGVDEKCFSVDRTGIGEIYTVIVPAVLNVIDLAV